MYVDECVSYCSDENKFYLGENDKFVLVDIMHFHNTSQV